VTEAYDENDLTQVPFIAALDLMFPTSSRFEPHLGAGIGFLYGDSNSGSGSDGAFEFVAGVRYRLDPRKEIGLSCRFIDHIAASLFAGEAVGDDTLNLSLQFAL